MHSAECKSCTTLCSRAIALAQCALSWHTAHPISIVCRAESLLGLGTLVQDIGAIAAAFLCMLPAGCSTAAAAATSAAGYVSVPGCFAGALLEAWCGEGIILVWWQWCLAKAEPASTGAASLLL